MIITAFDEDGKQLEEETITAFKPIKTRDDF